MMIHRLPEIVAGTVLGILSLGLATAGRLESAGEWQKGVSSPERILVLFLQAEAPSVEVWFSSREKTLPIKVDIPAGVGTYEISVPTTATEFRVKYDRAVSASEVLPKKNGIVRYEVVLEQVNEGGFWETLGIKTKRITIRLKKLKA